jgi:radical SAM superfamily enzyme YgiQ (UPF0313 family)
MTNEKFKVYSSQFNHVFNNQIHFPYSVASLVSYAQNFQKISDNFKFQKTAVFRSKIHDYVKRCNDADILLCSCYVWNWEITKNFAKQVKEINPNCLIIFGGPHVPQQSDSFFSEHPYVDIIVHGEGEIILKNILDAYLDNRDYSSILGLETNQFKNPPQPRIDSFETIPSPYLNNLVWNLVDTVKGIDWIASWETNRGCPYACTFCDWGSATNTKMRKFSEKKLEDEIEWFGKNKISYIDCCDANFGIFIQRDSSIAKKLSEVSYQNGFPKTFRPNWAKFSSEKIIPIAKELQKNGLLRAVTLSVQSLDENTLKIIKRENMKFKNFSELSTSFYDNGIPTYSEIILGLPGETLESFKKGLEIIASDTKIDTIQIYHCSILPNAPMNDVSYVKQFNIKKIKSPLSSVHSKIEKNTIQEFEEIIVSTCSFDNSELKEMYLYSWLIQTFHSLGILEYVCNFYQKQNNFSILDFYDLFLDFCRTQTSIFSQEFQIASEFMNDGYLGKGWDHYDSSLGEIYWPIEEASWLRLTSNLSELLNSINLFISFINTKKNLNISQNIMNDLIEFQLFLLTTKDQKEQTKSKKFNYDWKSFFTTDFELNQKHVKYEYKNLITTSDDFSWNYETIWFGRFKQKYKISPKKLDNVISLSKYV